jgi:hypothetical protein
MTMRIARLLGSIDIDGKLESASSRDYTPVQLASFEMTDADEQFIQKGRNVEFYKILLERRTLLEKICIGLGL